MPPSDSLPHYPAIEPAALWTVAVSLLGMRRSLRRDAIRLTSRLHPPLSTTGLEHLPLTGPFLIPVNHYSRPKFSTSWIALSISSLVAHEITWITVTEWVYPGQRREHLLRPTMRFVLSGIRRGYHFLAMPTMVPNYADPFQRADGVRKVIRAVQTRPNIILGFTPEGMDFPGGALGTPPPGAGRFILALNRMGLRILPAAVTETGNRLAVAFGEPYNLTLPSGLPKEAEDAFVSRVVMECIASLMNPQSGFNFSPLRSL